MATKFIQEGTHLQGDSAKMLGAQYLKGKKCGNENSHFKPSLEKGSHIASNSATPKSVHSIVSLLDLPTSNHSSPSIEEENEETKSNKVSGDESALQVSPINLSNKYQDKSRKMSIKQELDRADMCGTKLKTKHKSRLSSDKEFQKHSTITHQRCGQLSCTDSNLKRDMKLR